MLFRLLVLVIQLKELTIAQILLKLKRKYLIIIISISIHKNLRTENFVARLGKANLATKSDLYDLLKETDFDNKLNNISKIVI